MARETSVVTPERFQQGLSYSAYIDQIKVNKARFEEFYKFQVKPEDAKDLKELASRPNGPAKMLVLGEDWCGDVIRGMPMLSRVADAAGLEMSIFPRDDHHDIMNEYLKNGEWMSIPVAVFLHQGPRVHMPLDRASRIGRARDRGDWGIYPGRESRHRRAGLWPGPPGAHCRPGR